MKKILLTSVIGLMAVFGVAVAEEPKINCDAIYDVAAEFYGRADYEDVQLGLLAIGEAARSTGGITLYALMEQLMFFPCSKVGTCYDLVAKIVSRHNYLLEKNLPFELTFSGTTTDLLAEWEPLLQLIELRGPKIYTQDARYYAVPIMPIASTEGMLDYVFYQTDMDEIPIALGREGQWVSSVPESKLKAAVLDGVLEVKPLTAGDDVMFFSQLSFYESPNRENIIMKSRDLFEDFNDIMWPKTYEHISRESKKYLEYQQYHLDYDVAHELDFKNNTRNRMSVKERIESLEKDFSEFDQGFKNFFETADIKKFEYTQTSSLRQATNLVLQYFNSYIGDRDYRFYISSEGQEESNLFDCEGECNSLPGTDDNVTCSVKVGNRTFTKKFVFDDICD